MTHKLRKLSATSRLDYLLNTWMFRYRNRSLFRDPDPNVRTRIGFIGALSPDQQVKFIDEHPELLREIEDSRFEEVADVNRDNNPHLSFLVEQRRYLLRRARKIGIEAAVEEYWCLDKLMAMPTVALPFTARALMSEVDIVNEDTILFLQRTSRFLATQSIDANELLEFLRRCQKIGVESAVRERLLVAINQLDPAVTSKKR